MQTLYHGSRVVVEQPEIRIQKFHKDFYWGFYCTSYEQQARAGQRALEKPGLSMSIPSMTRPSSRSSAFRK